MGSGCIPAQAATPSAQININGNFVRFFMTPASQIVRVLSIRLFAVARQEHIHGRYHNPFAFFWGDVILNLHDQPDEIL